MRILECVFAVAAYPNLKRVLETLLESSERALLRFDVNGECPIRIDCTDALWVFNAEVGFKHACFDRTRIDNPVEISIDLKILHDFLRKCKDSRHVKLVLDVDDAWCNSDVSTYTPQRTDPESMQLTIVDADNVAVKNVLYHMHDIMPSKVPHKLLASTNEWIRIAANSFELNNIVLDLAVGAGEMIFTVHPNCDVALSSTFDNGFIETYWYAGKEHVIFESQHVPCKSITTEPYIVKFLKVICSLMIFQEKVWVHVQPKGPLLVTMFPHEHLDITATLSQYKGPREMVIVPEYLHNSLRMS